LLAVNQDVIEPLADNLLANQSSTQAKQVNLQEKPSQFWCLSANFHEWPTLYKSTMSFNNALAI
jgi:hypothetical protein